MNNAVSASGIGADCHGALDKREWITAWCRHKAR